MSSREATAPPGLPLHVLRRRQGRNDVRPANPMESRSEGSSHFGVRGEPMVEFRVAQHIEILAGTR